MACNKRGEKWRSNDVKITENVTFSNLFLPDRTLQGLQRCGFEVPSPVQLKAIPWGRCGCDLIVQAKSGTGKTCVMAVIALEGLVENSYTQALMLAPTREIAVQIRDVIRLMGSAFPNLQCHSFIGGVPVSEDHAKLSGCQIAVGTPGRIKHLIVENCLDTRAIRLFVLDEADVLLEKSFIDDINWIYSSLPSSKQVIALSATYPRSLAELLKRYMKNPKHLDINSKDQGLIGISQFYKNTQFHPIPDFADASKFSTLLDILSTITFSQCMIFCKQQARVQDIAENLNDKGFSICGISSSLDQADRLRIIAKLKHFQCRILVSTDLTARGIDAENVNLVVNYDFPNTPEAYLHRMGRAGRYGTSGIVISLISSDSDRNRLKSFQQHYHFTIDELPEPIPANLWGLIFERKFMVSPAMENGKAPGEKGISTESVEAFGCLVTPAIENSNHSVAENFEDNVNSDCVKNNLENFCNFPEANNMGNLNKNCKASETSKIINVLQNYEGLPEDFKGSGDFLLKRSEEEKVELNEVLNNKDSNTWYKNDVKQQQTENLCSPAVAKQQESSKNDHKYQHCKLDTQDEMCFDDHHSSADLLLNMKYDTLRDTDEKQCYQITVDNTETFSNRNGINEDSDLLSQKNDSDVQLKQNVHFDMSCIAKTYLEDGEVKYESKSFNVQTEGNFGENLSLLKACSITGDKENCNEMTVIAIKPTSSENKLKENDEILPQSSTCHQHIFPYTSYDTLERWKSYFEFGKSECDIDSPEKMSVTLSHIFNTSDTKETRLYATYEELLQDVTGTETLDLSNFIKCKEYDINNHLIHGGMDHVEKNILNNVEESVVANLNFKSSLITKGQPDELNINVSQNTNFSEIDMKNRNLDGALKMSLNDTLTPVYNKSSCIDANKNAGDVSKSTGNPKKIPSHCHNVIPSKNNLVLYSAEKDGNTNSSKSVSERKIGSNANELRHHTWLKKSNFGKTSDILPYFNSNEYSSPNECSKNLSYNEYVYAINGLIPCTIINTQNGKKTSKLNSFNKNHQFQQKGYEKHQVEQKIVSENENGVRREVFEEKKKDIKHGNWKKIPKDTLTEKKCSVFSTRKVATDVLMNKKPEYLRKDMGNKVKEYSKKRESQNMSWFPKCQKRELPSRNFNSSNFFPSGMQSKQSQNREKTKKYNLSSECSSSQPPCLKARGHLCCGERKYEEIRRKVCCCFHHVHCANSKVSFCCGNPLHEFDEIQSCLKCNIQKHEEAQRKVHCCHHRHHKSNITSACSCHLTQCSRENKNFNATQMVKCYRHFYEQWYYLCELSNWHC